MTNKYFTHNEALQWIESNLSYIEPIQVALNKTTYQSLNDFLFYTDENEDYSNQVNLKNLQALISYYLSSMRDVKYQFIDDEIWVCYTKGDTHEYVDDLAIIINMYSYLLKRGECY